MFSKNIKIKKTLRSTSSQPAQQWLPGRPRRGDFFIFIFLENIFYRNIFSISQFTALYPCRPAEARQGLICKLKKNYLRGSPWREPAAPLPPIHWAAGGLPPGRGAAGSRQGRPRK